MTEHEYIEVSNLAKLRSAYAVLGLICPDISRVIGKRDYQQVMRKINGWIEVHAARIRGPKE